MSTGMEGRKHPQRPRNNVGSLPASQAKRAKTSQSDPVSRSVTPPGRLECDRDSATLAGRHIEMHALARCPGRRRPGVAQPAANPPLVIADVQDDLRLLTESDGPVAGPVQLERAHRASQRRIDDAQHQHDTAHDQYACYRRHGEGHDQGAQRSEQGRASRQHHRHTCQN